MTNKERPILSDLVNAGTLDIEKFQNEIIRPIIKMQHHLLIASFQNYVEKRKIDFSILTEQKRRSRITSIYKTDNNHKNITLGFIIGHFTLDEFSFYTANLSEVHRRILQIITQRIKDSILELKL
jgi:hypothetical protein